MKKKKKGEANKKKLRQGLVRYLLMVSYGELLSAYLHKLSEAIFSVLCVFFSLSFKKCVCRGYMYYLEV
jgi:hypothetical protein